MRIICETQEELEQAKNMAIKYMCNNIPVNECIIYGNCDECIANHSIYIEIDEED